LHEARRALTGHRFTGVLLLVLLVATCTPPAARRAHATPEDELRPRIDALTARERECESRTVTIGQQRVNAATASYPSPEAQAADWDRLDRMLAAERRCTTGADDDILQILARLETECQRLDSAAALRCVERARAERAVRKQIQILRAEQYRCEQDAMRADASIRRGPAPDLRLLERRRADSVLCARSAGTKQEDLKRALAARAAGDSNSPAQQLAAETRAQSYERDTRALLDLLRRTVQGLSGSNVPGYETFTRDMDALQRGLIVYRSRYQGLIASLDAARPRKLLEAADLLVSTAGIWRAELQARREAAGVRTDVQAGSRSDASASARLALPDNRRSLEGFIMTEQAAAQQRAERWARARLLLEEASAASR
jgi:hypothetical protein